MKDQKSMIDGKTSLMKKNRQYTLNAMTNNYENGRQDNERITPELTNLKDNFTEKVSN